MINQITENFLRAQQVGENSWQSFGQQLELPKTDGQEDSMIGELYAHLTALWQVTPNMSSLQIIEQMQKFVAADGSAPYKNIPTHTGALAKVMELYKQEEGENSPMYAKLKNGVGLSVVSNGTLNEFTIKMLERPEEPESW